MTNISTWWQIQRVNGPGRFIAVFGALKIGMPMALVGEVAFLVSQLGGSGGLADYQRTHAVWLGNVTPAILLGGPIIGAAVAAGIWLVLEKMIGASGTGGDSKSHGA